jgi:hypothetical protein
MYPAIIDCRNVTTRLRLIAHREPYIYIYIYTAPDYIYIIRDNR